MKTKFENFCVYYTIPLIAILLVVKSVLVYVALEWEVNPYTIQFSSIPFVLLSVVLYFFLAIGILNVLFLPRWRGRKKRIKETESLKLARTFLGKEVSVTFDRPFGTKHPKYDSVYPVNYGFIPDTLAPDGGELDVYFLGTNESLQNVTGKCIAIIHRLDDDDDKLVVVPDGFTISDKEILHQVKFQEQYFKSIVIRK